jgi:hypothetical protein
VIERAINLALRQIPPEAGHSAQTKNRQLSNAGDSRAEHYFGRFLSGRDSQISFSVTHAFASFSDEPAFRPVDVHAMNKLSLFTK